MIITFEFGRRRELSLTFGDMAIVVLCASVLFLRVAVGAQALLVMLLCKALPSYRVKKIVRPRAVVWPLGGVPCREIAHPALAFCLLLERAGQPLDTLSGG